MRIGNVLHAKIHNLRQKINRKNIKSILRHSKKPIILGLGLLVFIFISTPIITYAWFVRDLSSKEAIMTRKNAGVILTDRFDTPFFILFFFKFFIVKFFII